MKIQNYYSILNLSEDSSCEELYQECRVLFVKYHPMTDKTEEAFRKFVSVNDAYGVLLDEEVRSDYDYLLSKYSEDNPVDLADKKHVEEIMNLIIKKRKGMKEMFIGNDSSLLSILLEVPLSFSSHHSSGGVSNLIEGLSFPDLDLSFDFDFNLFDFVDLN
jgi:curved DNA-binding protein CbpA